MLKIRFKIIEYDDMSKVIGTAKFTRKANDIFKAMEIVESVKKMYRTQTNQYEVNYGIKEDK